MIHIRTEYKTAVKKLLLGSAGLQLLCGLGESKEMANDG